VDVTLGQKLVYLADAATAANDDEDGFRTHLGASVVGEKCERRVWFGFRWADKEEFPGRMLRLFERGHSAEETVALVLRQMGATVVTTDPDGKQLRISDYGGHYGGATDGFAMNVPHIPQSNGKWIGLEMKTHNLKSFNLLTSKGVRESKPKHYRQAQVYMHYFKLECCLYCAVNKNDDELYFELIDYDPNLASMMNHRAHRAIFVQQLPQRIAETPSFFECRFCPMNGICFGRTMPRVNCRTCVNSQANPDGTWSCKIGREEIHSSPKKDLCPAHVYNPVLFQGNAEVTGYAPDLSWIQYRKRNGDTAVNGMAYTSSGNLDLC
jgi:ribosomal protein S27E